MNVMFRYEGAQLEAYWCTYAWLDLSSSSSITTDMVAVTEMDLGDRQGQALAQYLFNFLFYLDLWCGIGWGLTSHKKIKDLLGPVIIIWKTRCVISVLLDRHGKLIEQYFIWKSIYWAKIDRSVWKTILICFENFYLFYFWLCLFNIENF